MDRRSFLTTGATIAVLPLFEAHLDIFGLGPISPSDQSKTGQSNETHLSHSETG